MVKKKRTVAQDLEVEPVDRGIYHDMVIRQDGKIVCTIPPELQLGQLHNVWDVIGDALVQTRHPVVRQLCEMIRLSAEKQNLEGMAIFAYHLGRLVERAAVMPHEPAALTGKKCRSGGAAGAQAKRLTPAERQARKDFYLEQLAELAHKHENMNRDGLVKKLARRLGKGHSARTIYEYIPRKKL